MEHDSQPEAYYIHVWIRGIHPMLWRRFLVRSDSTLADLHAVLQIGFDWTDFHLHRFRIRKKDYAVPRRGESETCLMTYWKTSKPGILKLSITASKSCSLG